MSEIVTTVAVDIEKALIGGDLSGLKPEQRVEYYNATCKSLGLNPLTTPFAYIKLNGSLVLYARKDCTEQLRKRDSISLAITSREIHDGVYVVSATATRPDGRHDASTGAVSIDNLKGEAKANAMMKAETKAKRRVTLSICGLGILDESEIESIPGAVVGEPVNTEMPLLEAATADRGSKEAAQAVGQQKIKEQTDKAFSEMVNAITAFKPMIGEPEYYRVLDAHGVKHANGFTGDGAFERARGCWAAMGKAAHAAGWTFANKQWIAPPAAGPWHDWDSMLAAFADMQKRIGVDSYRHALAVFEVEIPEDFGKSTNPMAMECFKHMERADA